jgi:hypothetical protein
VGWCSDRADDRWGGSGEGDRGRGGGVNNRMVREGEVGVRRTMGWEREANGIGDGFALGFEEQTITLYLRG